jgi:hypothetical protein
MTRARRCGLVAAQVGSAAETNARLDAAVVRVEYVSLSLAGRIRSAADEMIDLPHGGPSG